MPARSSQFHIQLDGVPLTDSQATALAADIDKLVSTHLAKLDFRGDVAVGRPIALNPEWYGIWIRNQKLGKIVSVASLGEVSNVLPELKQRVG